MPSSVYLHSLSILYLGIRNSREIQKIIYKMCHGVTNYRSPNLKTYQVPTSNAPMTDLLFQRPTCVQSPTTSVPMTFASPWIRCATLLMIVVTTPMKWNAVSNVLIPLERLLSIIPDQQVYTVYYRMCTYLHLTLINRIFIVQYAVFIIVA